MRFASPNKYTGAKSTRGRGSKTDRSILVPMAMILLSVLLFSSGPAYALDPPHNELSEPNIDCDSCHAVHNALGDNLTNVSGNANLCLSCHVSGGQADDFPLLSSEQAVSGTSGIHHRWDHDVVAKGAAPSNPELVARLDGGTIMMCSTCHDQHSQTETPFDPEASETEGDAGRHFQRIDNDANQMCLDCHSDRDMTSVRTYTGLDLSHPVGVALPLEDGRFHDAPREPNGSFQIGFPRYDGNGVGDTNSSNNLVLDSAGRVQCMSCHNPHYADSDANTPDVP